MISFVTDRHAVDEVVYFHDFMWDLTDLETLVDAIPQLLPIAQRARTVNGARFPRRYKAIPGTFLGLNQVRSSVRPSAVLRENLMTIGEACGAATICLWVRQNGFPITAVSFTEERLDSSREMYVEIGDLQYSDPHYVRITYTARGVGQRVYSTDGADMSLTESLGGADQDALLLHIDDTVRGLASTIPQE